MPPADFQKQQSDLSENHSHIQCDKCRSIFESNDRQALSVLLLDQLTVPSIGCDAHLEQFTSVCGLTTDGTIDLLDHRPAGGIRCPGCRLAPHNAAQPMIPVQDGAVAVMACPEHQSEIVQRFYTGLQTQHHLTASLNPTTNSSL